MRRYIFIFYIITFIFLTATINLNATPFGWEDNTTQGWLGAVANSTTYYYSGRHSLVMSLDLRGRGFKSSRAILPLYSGKEGGVLGFKVYVPPVPEVPFDLQARIYVEDTEGKLAGSYPHSLFSNRWNDVSFMIPSRFKGPFSLSIVVGTQLEYAGNIYIDQPQGLFSELGSKELESNNTNPAYYRTYIPVPSLSEATYSAEPTPASEEALSRVGGLGTATSEVIELEPEYNPVVEDVITEPEFIIPEPATFLLVAYGLFSCFFRRKRANS